MHDERSETKHELIVGALADTGLEVFEQEVIPARPGQWAPVPGQLTEDLKATLTSKFPRGLYAHQAEALRYSIEGNDVCIATATASGKSLVFITAAIQLVLTNPDAKVLALYPSKALIRDQLVKWEEELGQYDLTVGYIDGGVQTALREGILERHRIILMTPDVAHAWLMAKLGRPAVKAFISKVRLLIMDEAHVYDGVFGTNMACFLRRLFAVSNIRQVITSTATIGQPADFIYRLTGREPALVDASMDGSKTAEKHLYSLVTRSGNFFDNTVKLVKALADNHAGRFIVFADSRKVVEQIVAIAGRALSGSVDDGDDLPEMDDIGTVELPPSILPYRSGYEEDDRAAIQDALAAGTLAGVVSTSALEMGLDIGDLDIVILLRTPASTKSFLQRIGRVGRKTTGYVLIVNDRASPTGGLSLQSLLAKKPEGGWLYLDNVYIQYAHALCAVQELSEWGQGHYKKNVFSTVPPNLMKLMENEINPVEATPQQLYPLKQRAQNGPHLEFMLRSDSGKTFSVIDRRGGKMHKLGSVNYTQALREAYPGAMYYYMARPYRVTQFSYRNAEVSVVKAPRMTTRPTLQNMVFPKAPEGSRRFRKSESGFLLETDVQVNERVLGFIEQQGKRKTSHVYGLDSPYSQKPLVRFFETTGVLWHTEAANPVSDAANKAILNAFCALGSIQENDLGLGSFYMRANVLWPQECRGYCIYDATPGSLRLSERLYHDFLEVLELAQEFVEEDAPDRVSVFRHIGALADQVRSFGDVDLNRMYNLAPLVSTDPDWMTVVQPDQKAIYRHTNGDEEVTIREYRYTPRGHLYRIDSPDRDEIRLVPCDSVIPLPGLTALHEVNLLTGEFRTCQSPGRNQE